MDIFEDLGSTLKRAIGVFIGAFLAGMTVAGEGWADLTNTDWVDTVQVAIATVVFSTIVPAATKISEKLKSSK